MSIPTVSNASGTIYLSDREPGSNEAGLLVGNFWLNIVSQDLYICIDATPFEMRFIRV
jgi:hypothetical protein